MENSSYNPEYEAQLENIEFYKRWIKDVFDYESQKSDVVYDYYQKLQALDPQLGGGRLLEFHGVDTSKFSAARDELVNELSGLIDVQLQETADDLQQNVFDANLFEVDVIVHDNIRYKVEKVVVFKGRVVPIVDDQPYHWPIAGIAFR
jgi:flagellar hook-associated protein FlgK